MRKEKNVKRKFTFRNRVICRIKKRLPIGKRFVSKTCVQTQSLPVKMITRTEATNAALTMMNSSGLSMMVWPAVRGSAVCAGAAAAVSAGAAFVVSWAATLAVSCATGAFCSRTSVFAVSFFAVSAATGATVFAESAVTAFAVSAATGAAAFAVSAFTAFAVSVLTGVAATAAAFAVSAATGAAAFAVSAFAVSVLTGAAATAAVFAVSVLAAGAAAVFAAAKLRVERSIAAMSVFWNFILTSLSFSLSVDNLPKSYAPKDNSSASRAYRFSL